MADFDAIIVGAGHNGLVAALYLARAGWRVAVLEANCEIGGGLRSAELTRPGFCHDRYATNVGFFAASPVYQELKDDFDALGVRLLRSDRPYASVHGSSALRVYADRERTEAEFAALSAADRSGWQRLNAFYQRTAKNFLPLFYTEVPSAALWRRLARLIAAGPGDALHLARLLVGTSRSFATEFFPSAAARGLFEAWGFHL